MAIPDGYPTPTTENFAQCEQVPVSDRACTDQDRDDVCIQCLFGGNDYNPSETTPTADAQSKAGDYLVTVTLGGDSAGQTYVGAEGKRGLLQPVMTAAGDSVTYSFVVDVRAMEAQPNHSGSYGGYPGLDLFFSGPPSSPPQVLSIGYELATAATQPIVVYIAGDSTTCDQVYPGFGGWGQMLPQFFDAPIGVANYANSGASSSSFYGSSSLWGAIKAHWTTGDWVMIQFGHNDKNASDAQVQGNLEKMVSEAEAAGVHPIVVSPPARVNGIPLGGQSVHEAAARAAAAAKSVPYINLTELSTQWYNSLSSESEAMTYHAPGDHTHTNLAGADELANLVAKEIRDQDIELSQYLREGSIRDN